MSLDLTRCIFYLFIFGWSRLNLLKVLIGLNHYFPSLNRHMKTSTDITDNLSHDLARLRALQDDWDDQGAAKIPEVLINIVQEVNEILLRRTVDIDALNLLECNAGKGLFISGATPSPDGSIDFWVSEIKATGSVTESLRMPVMQCTLGLDSLCVYLEGFPDEHKEFSQEDMSKPILVALVIEKEHFNLNKRGTLM
jgi:hypothetical protein